MSNNDKTTVQEVGSAGDPEGIRDREITGMYPDEMMELLSSGMGIDSEILRVVLEAKRGQPNKFPSLWEDDEEDVDNPSMEDIMSDPEKKFLWAAENDKLDIVKEMLDVHPELIKCRDSDLYTALHRASYNDHVDMARFLIEKGADIEAKTMDGWRPIHSACRWSNVEVASLLLQCGAQINAQTNGRQTALHLAAANKDSRETLQLLLWDPSIQPNLKNNAGETAKDICLRTSELYKLFEMADESIKSLQ